MDAALITELTCSKREMIPMTTDQVMNIVITLSGCSLWGQPRLVKYVVLYQLIVIIMISSATGIIQ